jgi:hypothetical protein
MPDYLSSIPVGESAPDGIKEIFTAVPNLLLLGIGSATTGEIICHYTVLLDDGSISKMYQAIERKDYKAETFAAAVLEHLPRALDGYNKTLPLALGIRRI